MKEEQPPRRDEILRNTRVGLIAGFLEDLATAHGRPGICNLELSVSLGALAKALRRHAERPLGEFIEELACGRKTSKGSSQTVREKPNPSTYSGLVRAEIVSLLDEQELGKNDLLAIAFGRFGIPPAGLKRLKNAQIAQAIRTAIANEEALGIIAEEAQRGGGERRS